jgi:hypothetical protein
VRCDFCRSWPLSQNFTIRLHENRILAPQQVTLLGVRTCCSDFDTNGASYQQFDVTTTPTILHT